MTSVGFPCTYCIFYIESFDDNTMCPCCQLSMIKYCNGTYFCRHCECRGFDNSCSKTYDESDIDYKDLNSIRSSLQFHNNTVENYNHYTKNIDAIVRLKEIINDNQKYGSIKELKKLYGKCNLLLRYKNNVLSSDLEEKIKLILIKYPIILVPLIWKDLTDDKQWIFKHIKDVSGWNNIKKVLLCKRRQYIYNYFCHLSNKDTTNEILSYLFDIDHDIKLWNQNDTICKLHINHDPHCISCFDEFLSDDIINMEDFIEKKCNHYFYCEFKSNIEDHIGLIYKCNQCNIEFKFNDNTWLTD